MKKGTWLNIAIFSLIAAMAIFTLSACGGDNGNEDKTSLEVLSDLNIDTSVADDPRTDVNKQDLPDDYNPMSSRKRTVLMKDCDIYTSGLRPAGVTTTDYLASTDGLGLTGLAADSDGAWATAYYNKSVAADTDGDGQDEVIIAVWDTANAALKLKMIKNNAGTYVYSDVAEYADADVSTTYLLGPDCMDMASGDVDGDGKDEIAVIYYNKIVLFDDEEEGFAYRTKDTYTLDNSAITKIFYSVAMADFDADGCDEIVSTNGNFSNTAQYRIYDDMVASKWKFTALSITNSAGSLATTATFQNDASATNITLLSAAVKTGDVNNDNIPDAVFCGRNKDVGNYSYIIVLAGSRDANSELSFAWMDTCAYDPVTSMAIPSLAVGDIDGNGSEEIAMFDTVYEYIGGRIFPMDKGGYDQIAGGSRWDGLKFGNVDDDVALELFAISWSDNYLRVFEYTSANAIVCKSATALSYGPNAYTYSFCLPSINAKAVALEFDRHEVTFTDPRIIAVLAAPPYYASLNGNKDPEAIQPDLGNAGTVYGMSTGSGNESSSSNGFSVGVSVGYHQETPFWGSAGSAEFKATVESSFDWTSSQATETTYSYSYNNSYVDDMVVYTVVPVDCYYYTVLSSPDEAAVGTSYIVTLPRKPQTTSMDRTTYNEKCGDFFKVDEEVMTHTIGLPTSYQTSTDRDTLIVQEPSGLYDVQGNLLGFGVNTQTVNIEQMTTSSETFGWSLSIGFEFETVSGGLLLGVNADYEHSAEYTTTVSNGIFVEGSVAALNSEIAENSDCFTWGLMSYPMEKGTQKFSVVTYWVDLEK